MVGKRAEAHKRLVSNLLDAATNRIEARGLEQLRARDVTNDAGCGLGTLYKCYIDLDDLIVQVNSQTLKKLRLKLSDAVIPSMGPQSTLKQLALAYLDFAENNKNLWLAVFNHRADVVEPIPEWHRQENTALLEQIANPMRKIYPELNGELIDARARTYFAAVHGIVSIKLQDRFISLSGALLRSELEHLVSQLTS